MTASGRKPLLNFGNFCLNECPLRGKADIASQGRVYRVGTIKLFSLFLTAQTLSQFVFISDGTGSDSALPEPAASLVRALALTKLDFAGFVPFGCVFRGASFYDVFLFKITSPLVVIALMWTRPLWKYLRRDSHAEAWQTAARFSILLIELVLPMVSTSICHIFL